jgi:putative DNA-invertase from lambdoid prophage Rac
MEAIYARVSTLRQDTDNQLVTLRKKYPNAAVIEEVKSGAKYRPEFEKLVERLKSGDTLVVVAVDRLGRNTLHVLQTIETLLNRGVKIQIENMGLTIDRSNPFGMLMVQMLSAFAELERSFNSERTKRALAALKSEGKQLGRRKKWNKTTAARIKHLLEQGVKVKEIAKKEKLSEQTVRNVLKLQ